jgi:rubrerythrin
MVLEVDFSRLDGQDVLDLAIQVEQEAEDNYLQLADWFASDGNEEVSAFFTRMAGFETKHRQQLEAQRKALFGDAPPRHSDSAPWQVETPDYSTIGRTVDIEEAFEIAMASERRAGDYYGGALEYASDPDVIALFEALQKAEEDHLRMLRSQRARSLGAASDA